jgi:hypothetical protein
MNSVDEPKRSEQTPPPPHRPALQFKPVLERSFYQHLQTCTHCTDLQLCEAGTKLFRTWAAI